MRRSKKLDNILDECLELILLNGESIEQCLQRYPGYADDLKPLLETILSARVASDVEPRPEFRARARYQFRLALQEAKAKKRRRFFGWQPAWVTVVATVLTLVLLSGVTVAAAGNSMPDEPLYPVKVATEQLQLTVTRSLLSKAELHARLADKRVAEIIYLAHKGKSEAIESTIQRLNTNLLRIAALSRVQSEAPAAPGVVPALAPAKPGRQIAPPEPAKGELAPSKVLPGPSTSERAPVKVSPGPPRSELAPSEQIPGEPEARLKRIPRIEDRAKLRAALIRYAKNHPEALRAALKNAPPSVRAALRRAIAISEARYKEVNQALEPRGTGAGEREPQKVLPERSRSERTPQKGSSEPTRGEVVPKKVSPRRSLGERSFQRVPPGQPRSRVESDVPIQRIKARAKLRAAIVSYAKNHPEALRDVLQDASRLDRPTLYRAIDTTGSRS